MPSEADLSFRVEPVIRTTRFLLSDGHVVDVEHTVPGDSSIRLMVLDRAAAVWGKDDRRKIEGSTWLPLPFALDDQPAKPRKSTRKRAPSRVEQGS